LPRLLKPTHRHTGVLGKEGLRACFHAYLIPSGGDDDAILAITKDVVVRAGGDKATHDKLLRYARLER